MEQEAHTDIQVCAQSVSGSDCLIVAADVAANVHGRDSRVEQDGVTTIKCLPAYTQHVMRCATFLSAVLSW